MLAREQEIKHCENHFSINERILQSAESQSLLNSLKLKTM
jgi:hypothetical protein